MSTLDRPDSVLEEGRTLHAGHNCVACVAAVLYNETNAKGFATANLVARRYQISPSVSLTPERALEIIRDFAKLTPTPGRAHPWESTAPQGHYAVFCMGRTHVIYGHKQSDTAFYLFDPQTERHLDLGQIQRDGFGPFRSYHFAG